MTSQTEHPQDDRVDVRALAKPERHPAIFAAFDALEVGGSFVLVNDHDPRHLRDDFELNHPAGYTWEYLRREPDDWQVRITRLTRTPLPRVLTREDALTDDRDAGGAIWKLEMRDRDIDANIIALPAGGAIAEYTGGALDILLHVISGSGEITTERDPVAVAVGDVVFLPHDSRRGITAGPDGLRYLSVHRRKQALGLRASLNVGRA